MTAVRVLYTDVDGTLVGPLGNLFWTEEATPTLAAAEALLRAHAAGLEIVAISGRGRVQMFELGRLLGLSTWFCELGAIRVYERGQEIELRRGGAPDGRLHDVLQPAARALVAHFAGRLEAHDPWNEGREMSFLLRGAVDTGDARAWLDAHDLAWAELIDNGVIPRTYPGLPGVETVRAYHLASRGVSKREAIRADQQRREIEPGECAMVGDSLADLACHTEVARCFIVANAIAKDPSMASAVASAPNAEVTSRGHTEGFAEAVAALLG